MASPTLTTASGGRCGVETTSCLEGGVGLDVPKAVPPRNHPQGFPAHQCPRPLAAQTGWTQGAAVRVGAFFVHLDGKRRGRPDRILPPDSPWRCVTPVAGGGGGAHVA